MTKGKIEKSLSENTLKPLPESLQLGTRVYRVLLDSIVSGRIEPGTPLRPEIIARRLEVSTTPVREAMQQLESDGLVTRLPYQGWFVREFTKQQIRELYEFRAAMESFGVRLACQRITDEEAADLRRQQSVGEKALAAGDTDSYRIYNQNLHDSIMRAARNAYLSSVMGQMRLQSAMLTAKTIRIAGRPARAIEEHGRLIELIAKRDAAAAEQVIRAHILSALEDCIRFDSHGSPSEEQSPERVGGKTRDGKPS